MNIELSLRKLPIILLSLVFCSLTASAQGTSSLSTGWLEPEPGSSGDRINAEVTAIERSDSGGAKIDLRIPLDDIDSFEQIEVISRQTQEPIPLDRPPTWIEVPGKETQGLKLFLKQYPRYEFRIRFVDSEADSE